MIWEPQSGIYCLFSWHELEAPMSSESSIQPKTTTENLYITNYAASSRAQLTFLERG
jgi:hypothetical protein